MKTIRLGLIAGADTLTETALLPYEAIEQVFRRMDGILYVGQMRSDALLDALSSIAPTQAMPLSGKSQKSDDKYVLSFGQVRVGLTHGNRHPMVERYFQLQQQLGNLYAGGRHLLDTLLQRFSDDDVNVIVFGHLQAPMHIRREGIVLINPGVVHPITPEQAQWQLLHEQDPQRSTIFQQHIRTSKQKQQLRHSTVGILEIEPGRMIRAQVHRLPLYAYTGHNY
ncbi:MAG: hypothetical protein ACFE0Q_16845 [Anaerolineae bacterium]